MAFGILRVREMKAGDLKNTDLHNARLYDDEKVISPGNIEPGEAGAYGHNKYFNRFQDESFCSIDKGGKMSLEEVVNERLKEAGVKPRSNSNVAIEVVLTASCGPNEKQLFDGYSADGFFANSQKWLNEQFGQKNVVATYLHYDESNPHAHYIITPVVQKEVKWKNSRGEGIKTKNCLSARDFTGSREKLRNLQQKWYEHLSQRYNQYADFYRGTLVEHQSKEYTRKTSREIGDLRNDLRNSYEELEKLQKSFKSAEIGAKEYGIELDKKQKEIKELSKGFEKLEEKSLEKSNEFAAKRDKQKQRSKSNWKRGKDGFDFGY